MNKKWIKYEYYLNNMQKFQEIFDKYAIKAYKYA